MDITKLTGHTPGPLAYSTLRVMDDNGRLVATIDPRGMERGECDANGHLFRCAPSLLTLAKMGLELAEYIEADPLLNCDPYLADKARALLNQAKGEL